MSTTVEILPANRSWMSLLVAFDLERSYVFRPQPGKGPDKRQRAAEQWDKIWRQTSWDTTQLPSNIFFSNPLGWLSTFTFDTDTCPSLDKTIESITTKIRAYVPSPPPQQRPDAKDISLRALVFPFGIGVLIIEVLLPQAFDGLQKLVADLPRDIIDERKQIIREVSARYTSCMRKVASRVQLLRQPQVVRLRATNRERAHEEGSAYRLLFLDPATYNKRIAEIEQMTGVPQRSRESSSGPGQEVSYNGAKVYVGWVEGLVQGHTPESKSQIETNFVVALASWYALVVMNVLITDYLVDAFCGLPSSSAGLSRHKKLNNTRRLAYMEAASALQPIRWTMKDKDLRLLESIHSNWSSKRWWTIVEERVQLLAMHYEQLEVAQKDQRNLGFVVFGTTIAGVTLGSAIADVIGLFPKQAKYLTTQYADISSVLGDKLSEFGFILAIAVPLTAAVFIIGFGFWSLWPRDFLERIFGR